MMASLADLAARYDLGLGTSDQIRSAYTEQNIRRRFDGLAVQDRELLVQMAVLSAAMEEMMPMHFAARHVNERLEAKGVGEKKLRELAESGLLFVIGEGWKEFIAVPLEVCSSVISHYAGDLADLIQRRPLTGKVEQTDNAGLALYHDLLTITAACVHEPIEVSQKGAIYKRTVQRMLKLVNSKESFFPSHFDDGLSRSVNFIVSFLKYRSVIALNEYVLVKAEPLEAFLTTDYMDWCEWLRDYYLKFCFMPRTTAFSFVDSIMVRLGQVGWSSADEALRIIGDRMDGWGMNPGREKLEQIAIWSYVTLGLMKLGKDRQGERAFQWTDWGKEYLQRIADHKPKYVGKIDHLLIDHIIVQPNLEIVVPENVLPTIRWRVEALADLKQADSVLIYALSKTRLVQAMNAGWSLESIRGFLDGHSRHPVAANVYQTIRGWLGNCGKVQLWDVMALQLNDPQLADAVRQDKQLSRLIVASLSPDCMVIRRSDERQVRDLLELLGYPPALRVQNPDADTRSPSRFSGGAIQRMDGNAHRNLVYERNLDVFAPDFCSSVLK